MRQPGGSNRPNIWLLTIVVVVLSSGVALVRTGAPAAALDLQAVVNGVVSGAASPPGVDTGVVVSPGTTVTITATGSVNYGNEGVPCVGRPTTDPDGNRFIDGVSCGPPKVDPSATLGTEPIGKLLYAVVCPLAAGAPTWQPAGSKTTFPWIGCASARIRLVYNDSVYEDNSGEYAWTVTTSPTTTTSSTTTTTTTTTTPPPPVDRYAITSYDRMASGAPHNGYFLSAYQAFVAQSNRITYLGVTVGTPNYTPDGHTVRIRLCADSGCNQALAEGNPQITNYGNSFADIGDVAVNPGQQYYIVWYQPALWHNQTWVTYWWAGGNSIGSSDQMQAVVKGFNSTQPPPPPPPATNYRIETDGRCANVRTGAGTQFQAVACLPNGTPIGIECQTRGGPASTNSGQISYIWDRLSTPNGGNYVSDILTSTPNFNAFSPGIPQCDGGGVTPPPPPGGSYDCEIFVADVTIPDGNCGNTNWSDLTAVRVGGTFGPTSFNVPVTAPGATTDISVSMTAPNSPGSYKTTYRLAGPRGLADQKEGFWVIIDVVNSGGTTPPPGTSRYVALGDSYSSGEGNPLFLNGTDTPSNRCHRSLDSYPQWVGRSAINPGTRFEDWACSGAVIGNFYDNIGGSGQWNEGAQLNHLAPAGSSDPSVALVTLTIGGNDIGFPGVLDGCVNLIKHANPVPCQARYESPVRRAIASLGEASNPRRLSNLFREIQRRAPQAKILVLAYPHLFPDSGLPDKCSGILRSDARWINAMGSLLNQMIASEARTAGGNVRFVATGDAFAGHEMCTRQPWINEIRDAAVMPTEDRIYFFHPNASGQLQLATFVFKALRS